ncbi:MAG: DUF2227 family putative metal-binding protein [Chlamydiales bacterium]|nr:DUF2227 family putative metal-binding protein [Chlamydiales bacterium]
MAQYKTHTIVNLLIGLPLVYLLLGPYFHLPNNQIIICSSSFIIGTLFMSPDMDVADKIKIFSLRGILSLPFRLYAKVFKHRGISHVILLGTITRLVWIAFLMLLVFYLIYRALPSTTNLLTFYRQYKGYILFAFLGIVIADVFHLIVDFSKPFK